jgi:hypothetical protein
VASTPLAFVPACTLQAALFPPDLLAEFVGHPPVALAPLVLEALALLPALMPFIVATSPAFE